MKNLFLSFVLKLTTKNYKSPIRRALHKSFFKSCQLVFRKKRSIDKLKFLDDNFLKFEQNGFVILNKSLLKEESLEKLNRSINLSKTIFLDKRKEYSKINKPYLMSVDFTNDPIAGKTFYELFTDRYFIDIAQNYFNEMPLLSEIKLLHSPITHDKIFTGSQLFHSDFDDSKLMKIFIYLNDVDKESGPLEIVSKSITKEIISKSKYRWGQVKRNYKSHDDNLLNLFPNDNIVTPLVGDEGTISIVDTVNCLHRGSRNPTKERLVLYATYSTRTSFRNPPINWFISGKSTDLVSNPLLSLDPDKSWLGKYAFNN
jgi:hypothetical protein